MAAKATSSIQVIARVSRLLDNLAAHDGPLNLKALADATGLHPSTAFRILASLIEHGFVERSTAGHYWLGAKLLRLGNRVRGQLDLRREARSIMERLRDRTGEAVNLSVREGDEVVYVERVTTPRIMRVEQVIGGRAPLHVTAAGKLFLADDGVEAGQSGSGSTESGIVGSDDLMLGDGTVELDAQDEASALQGGW